MPYRHKSVTFIVNNTVTEILTTTEKMTTQLLLLIIFVLTVLGFFLSQRRAKQHRKQSADMHSLPRYYGYYTALWVGVPSVLLLLLWSSLDSFFIDTILKNHLPQSLQNGDMSLILNDIKLASTTNHQLDEQVQGLVALYRDLQTKSVYLQSALVVLLSTIGIYFGYRKFSPQFRSRNFVERWIKYVLMLCSFIAIITTVGIVASVLFESLIFFKTVSPIAFLFGTQWNPTAPEPSFGAVPLFVGTLMISLIALLIAVPIGLLSAIYLSEYAGSRWRNIIKPILELLAGIPTVVYGFFAVLTIAPAFRGFGEWLGISVASESALAAGVVMGVMIIPFVSSLSDDAINAVPQYLRDGSLGLGATKSETIKQVVLPAALPGIVGGVLLAASRAIGETMIVVMAAGLAANLTANPLQAVTTVTVQIVTLLTGDQEFDSAKTLSAFALALLLFVVTLMLNLLAMKIVKKYREQYE